MARPKRNGERPQGLFCRLEAHEMEAFKQLAVAQRRPVGNLAAAILAEYIKANSEPEKKNGHTYKAPRIRAPQTI